MIVVPLKEGENIEKALKKFKRKFEKTGVVKELRNRQAFEKPSVAKRKQTMRAVYFLRTAFATSRRIIIASGLVLLNSYSYFRCMNVDATRIC